MSNGEPNRGHNPTERVWLTGETAGMADWPGTPGLKRLREADQMIRDNRGLPPNLDGPGLRKSSRNR